MSELTPIELECNMGKDANGVEHREPWKAYDIDEVDALVAEKNKDITELRDESAELHNRIATLLSQIRIRDERIDELKAKLESVQASMYADVVDAGMENRKLKRALWLARAERAHVTTLLWNVYCYQNNCLYFRDFMNVKCNPFRNLTKKTAMEWSDLWESIETKCLDKAEEYK